MLLLLLMDLIQTELDIRHIYLTMSLWFIYHKTISNNKYMGPISIWDSGNSLHSLLQCLSTYIYKNTTMCLKQYRRSISYDPIELFERHFSMGHQRLFFCVCVQKTQRDRSD